MDGRRDAPPCRTDGGGKLLSGGYRRAAPLKRTEARLSSLEDGGATLLPEGQSRVDPSWKIETRRSSLEDRGAMLLRGGRRLSVEERGSTLLRVGQRVEPLGPWSKKGLGSLRVVGPPGEPEGHGASEPVEPRGR